MRQTYVLHRMYGLAVRAGVALALLAGITSLPARSVAQDSTAHTRRDTTLAAYRFRVLGVFDATSGQPVADADVIDILTGTSAGTTRTGTVSLSFLPDGGGLVRIRKLGYEMQTMAVAISPADTIPITVVLQPAVVLPTVTTVGAAHYYISPNLRGFEDRRLHSSTGYFVPDSVLRKEESRTLGNVLLSHVPGINIKAGSQILLLQSPRCSMLGPEAAGPPDVYLDGVLLAHPMTTPSVGRSSDDRDHPFDLMAFKVSDLAGVEYYPDGTTLPLEFSHTTKGCGALLLWTREK